MADVYLAVLHGAQGFEKQTIVKRIRDGLADDEEYRRMFIEEARLMASLSHSNIVSVLDFGEGDGGFYIALEYVEGLDLAGLLKQVDRLPPPMVIYLCSCVLQALSYVHTRAGRDGGPLHIVHRDVSPSNVFLGRNGDVKLGDFGVAKVAHAAVQTLPGTVKGKLAYMSPEQAAADEVDGRADLYSVGVVVFEALLGRRPDLDVELLHQILEGDPSKLQSIDPQLSPALGLFLRRALAHDREARFQTAEEMARALVACAPGPLPGPTDVARLVVANSPAPGAIPAADPFAAALGLLSKTTPAGTTPGRPSPRTPPTGKGHRAAAVLIVGLLATGALGVVLKVLATPAPLPPPVVATVAPLALPAPPPQPVAPDPAPPDPPPVAVRPAVPPAAHRPRAPKGAKALLSVNSTPWAKVFVDGTYQGDTPLQGLALEPGRHRLRLVNPASGRSFETPLELAPGEQRTLPIDLEAGTVTSVP